MTRRIFILSLTLLIAALSGTSQAQVQISGPQSGVLVDTTYIVDGGIYVPAGQRLFIAPGAVFLFNANTRFDINGYLHAAGTESDSIIFRPRASQGWTGMHFLDSADDSSLLEYCLITGSRDRGLRIYHASPTINHCSIVSNTTNYAGGGIYCDHSKSIISHCLISSNSASVEGGGIEWDYGNVQLLDCAVSNNTSDLFGGGVEGYYGSGLIANCLITGNVSRWGGGGIAIFDTPAMQIINCTINYNRATNAYGGGIEWLGGNAQVIDCIISNNASQGVGGGIDIFNAAGLIANCLITGNVSSDVSGGGGGIATYSYYSPTVRIQNCTISRNRTFGTSGGGIFGNNHTGSDCIIWGNLPDQISGSGQYSYCDVQGGWPGVGNINQDPLFVSGLDGNFYLSQIAAGQTQQSPCVDAGDPLSAMILGTTRTDGVPDSGIVDMGYHYPLSADASMIASDQEDELFIAHNLEFRIAVSPNPFNASTAISFELRAASFVKLGIYDLSGRMAATLVDGWSEAGSHEVTFDASGLPSGVYVARLDADGASATQKLVLMK